MGLHGLLQGQLYFLIGRYGYTETIIAAMCTDRNLAMHTDNKRRSPIRLWKDRRIGQEDGSDMRAQGFRLAVLKILMKLTLRAW
jgi:hypothetical protein